MIKKIKSIKWNEGASEMLSFAIVVPFIVILICAIFSAAQISTSVQKLTYSSYSACRAAVVSENSDFAETRAEAVMREIYGDNLIDGGFDFVFNSSPTNNETYYKLELVGGQGTEWEKGNMVKCTVYQYINPLMPFSASYHTQSIVMMIENGVSEEIAVDPGTG